MGFVSIALLARIILPQELGTWLLYLMAFTFADMLRSGVVHTAVVRFYSESREAALSGAAWIIGVGISLAIGLLVWSMGFLAPGLFSKSGLELFSTYFPGLFLASLPFNMALWLLQAENRFQHLLYLRLFFTLPFFIFILSGLHNAFNISTLIQAHLACYLLASLIAIGVGWTRLSSIRKTTWPAITTLLHFGKYSVGTLLCTNLLKSSDTFMISWFLGPSAVAVYNLPYKLIELIEIPLRSAVSAALPQLSRSNQQTNLYRTRQLFNQNVGVLTLGLLPLIILAFLFADYAILLLGGKQYSQSADIFRILIIYSVLLPADRFIGVTLDSLNKPHLNLLKVAIMVVANISGNLIVLNVFRSSVPVAITTIITVVCGIVFGSWALNKFFVISSRDILTGGLQFIIRNVKLNRTEAS